MKRFFIIFSLMFFLFFLSLPKNTFALEKPNLDLGSDIEEKEILCRSNDDYDCSTISNSNKRWNSGWNNWQSNDFVNSVYGDILNGLEKNMFVGPSSDNKYLLSGYIDRFSSADYSKNHFLSYQGFSGKKYRAYIFIASDLELQTYTQIENYNWIFNLYNSSDFSLIDESSEFFVGFLKYNTNDSSYPFGYCLFFEFESISDFNNFRFLLSSEDLANIYLGNANSSNATAIYYNFSFVETNKLLLADDTELPDNISNSIEKIVDSKNALVAQDNLFDDLEVCETMDLGCHFSNLWKTLKGIFERLGIFFKSILDTIIDFFSTMFSIKLFNVDAVFESLREIVNSDGSGLSSVITSPLNYIKGYVNNTNTCNSLVLPISGIISNSIILECPSVFYNKFPTLYSIYETVTTGLIAYWCLVNILALTLNFKEPSGDKIEVIDL